MKKIILPLLFCTSLNAAELIQSALDKSKFYVVSDSKTIYNNVNIPKNIVKSTEGTYDLIVPAVQTQEIKVYPQYTVLEKAKIKDAKKLLLYMASFNEFSKSSELQADKLAERRIVGGFISNCKDVMELPKRSECLRAETTPDACKPSVEKINTCYDLVMESSEWRRQSRLVDIPTVYGLGRFPKEWWGAGLNEVGTFEVKLEHNYKAECDQSPQDLKNLLRLRGPFEDCPSNSYINRAAQLLTGNDIETINEHKNTLIQLEDNKVIEPEIDYIGILKNRKFGFLDGIGLLTPEFSVVLDSFTALDMAEGNGPSAVIYTNTVPYKTIEKVAVESLDLEMKKLIPLAPKLTGLEIITQTLQNLEQIKSINNNLENLSEGAKIANMDHSLSILLSGKNPGTNEYLEELIIKNNNVSESNEKIKINRVLELK